MHSYLTSDIITSNNSFNFNKNIIDNKLNNYNDDNNNNNYYEYCKNGNKITDSNQYSLNIHCFNPTKNSPPNEWQYRLIKRINSFNNITNIN
tara:strand:- start:1499 stop:1774 length:276 start_codon:yes stop_codon:yes gene_type:complete